jgi:hypothetical protein
MKISQEKIIHVLLGKIVALQADVLLHDIALKLLVKKLLPDIEEPFLEELASRRKVVLPSLAKNLYESLEIESAEIEHLLQNLLNPE